MWATARVEKKVLATARHRRSLGASISDFEHTGNAYQKLYSSEIDVRMPENKCHRRQSSKCWRIEAAAHTRVDECGTTNVG